MRGKKSDRHPSPLDPPRRRANKWPGRGTFATDRPPIISLIARETGEVRLWVCDHADKETCEALVATSVPADGTVLYTDELASYIGVHPTHGSVSHGAKEWARDDDGDGIREVHCNTCEGLNAALRTFLRPFRGVHKAYLACYVALFEALTNAKQMTAHIIRRMCFGAYLHTNYT